MFLLDVEVLLKSLRPFIGQEGTKLAPNDLDRLRLILSMLLTPGLHEGIDEICREKLRIPTSIASVGYQRFVIVPD